MSCKKFHELISIELDGLLDNEKLSELNEHCKACMSCRKKRINATKASSICSNQPVNTKKKGKLKIILLSVFLIVILFVAILSVNSFKKPTVVTDTPQPPVTENAPAEITENEKNNTYAPVVKEEPAMPENTVSSYEPPEQIQQPVVPYIPETPVVPSSEATEAPTEQTASEQEQPTTTEPEAPEETEDAKNSDEAEAPPEETSENISLISSEKSRTEVFDAIHASSPQTETVSADSDFQLEITNEEFSAIVEYLNSSGTEFVISKTPETAMVTASFVFNKDDDDERLQQEDLQSEPHQPQPEIADEPVESDELPNEETIETTEIEDISE